MVLEFQILKCLKPSLLLFALIFWYSADAQVVNPSADSLLKEVNDHLENDSIRVLLLNQLAYANYYADPLASFKYGLEAKKIADNIHYSKGQADACRQIGMAYWEQGNIPNALNYFLEGLRIAELNHHPQVEADITSNIGTAYNSMGNPKEALIFLLRARQMQRRLMNKLRESAVLNNIGDSYLAMNQYAMAKDAYSTALDYSIHNGYKLGVTTNLRNLGNVFEANSQYDSALTHYFKCIKLSEQINDHRGYILSHKSIASVYFKIKKFSLAKHHGQTALGQALKRNLRAIIRDLYDLLYKIAEAENDQNKSFEYFRLFVAYKDSVQNLKVESKIAAERLRFESNKKQAEIELLKKNGELQSEGIMIKNTQLTFIAVLALLAILFLVISTRNYRRIKVKNNELAVKNDEVNQQHIQIKIQHDELIVLNEELRSQQEEVMSQRDALAEKNKEIETMSKQVAEVNEKLEQLVAHRTEALENQNTKLSGYAFLNAHKLRAPLARIMGLVNLLQMKSNAGEKPVIMNHLANSSDELSEVASTISKAIQDEFNPSPK
ncbi:MAG: tetratricopeptide repeat protein [Bacteroidetes bacterium]|nr:tetratricopeptide repeat protein [Bacteroidota bacterium]